MLHAGLDLSRKKIDVCLLSPAGEIVDEWASPPDADGLRGLAARAGAYRLPVRGVIESSRAARPDHGFAQRQRAFASRRTRRLGVVGGRAGAVPAIGSRSRWWRP